MELLFLAIGDKEISTSKRMHSISSKIKTFQVLRDRMMIYFYGFIFLKHWCHRDCWLSPEQFQSWIWNLLPRAVINTSLRLLLPDVVFDGEVLVLIQKQVFLLSQLRNSLSNKSSWQARRTPKLHKCNKKIYGRILMSCLLQVFILR